MTSAATHSPSRRIAASSRASSSSVASTPFAAGPSGAAPRRTASAASNARMNAAATSTAIPGETHASRLNPDLRRRHQHALAVRRDERVDDLLRAVAAVDERHHVAVHRRRDLAGKVRRAAGEDVERAAALAMHADARARRAASFVSCLTALGLGGKRTGRAAPWSIANRFDVSRTMRRVVRHPRCARSAAARGTHRDDAPTDPGDAPARNSRRETSPARRSCADRLAAGLRRPHHRDVSRLRATTLGLRPHHDQAADHHHEAADPHPHHERIERDAQLGRVRSRTPASTTYVSSFAVVRMPTSVIGWKSGLPWRVEVCALLARDDPDALPVAERLEPDGR